MGSIAKLLITTRASTLPKRLVAPGPSEEQLEQLFELAAAAPNHGSLIPWRFIVVPVEERQHFADVFARALVDRDSCARPEQIEAAKEKAHRAPCLVIAVVRLGAFHFEAPEIERMVSLGAAIQNILLGAHSMGFGSGLTSGKAMATPRMAELLGLGVGEVAVCCINMGTVTQTKARSHVRPRTADFVSVFGRQ